MLKPCLISPYLSFIIDIWSPLSHVRLDLFWSRPGGIPSRPSVRTTGSQDPLLDPAARLLPSLSTAANIKAEKSQSL